jgi:KDO2-lipid IV(A) lauroyltransferase
MWRYYVLRIAYLLLGRLPIRVLYGIAHVAGDGAYRWRRETRDAVASNMRQLMGQDAEEDDVQRATREVFRNAGRYYADFIHLGRVDVQRFYDEQLDIEGEEYLKDAEESGRGGIIVGTHFGNPEMAVQPLAAKGYSIMGLTEPLEPKALSDFTDKLRSQHGHVYSSLGYKGLKETIRRLKSGGLVAILLDRNVSGSGVPMQFCGAEAMIPLGAIDLALRTGADLIPAKSWRTPGYSFKIRVEPPLEIIRTDDFDADVRANAERLLPIFEEQLKSDPGQWAVLEAIWKEQPQEGSAVQ